MAQLQYKMSLVVEPSGFDVLITLAGSSGHTLVDVSNCVDCRRVEVHVAQLMRSPLDKATSTTHV
jgi:hypothetical protein